MGKAEAVRAAVRGAADALVAVTLAPRCVACSGPLDAPTGGVVCGACWSTLQPLVPPLCQTCGDPLPSWRTLGVALQRCAACRRRPHAVDRGRAAGDHRDVLREIIHAFKYEGRRSLARPLGRLMAHAGGDLLQDAACVVPVPLHPWRRFRRGFNQAADLAAWLDLPVSHALWRAQATATQAGLTASARRRNVRGAFRMSPLLTRRERASYITDAVIVLVDDVRTTGATLDACAQVLKAAGAREVRALTVARAGLEGRRSPEPEVPSA